MFHQLIESIIIQCFQRSKPCIIGFNIDSTCAPLLHLVAAGHTDSAVATFGGDALAGAGGFDALLWKATVTGTTLWARRGGGTGNDHLRGVAVDARDGAVVAAGFYYSATVTFGGVVLPRSGGYDAALWKLSSEGTTLWALRGECGSSWASSSSSSFTIHHASFSNHNNNPHNNTFDGLTCWLFEPNDVWRMI